MNDPIPSQADVFRALNSLEEKEMTPRQIAQQRVAAYREHQREPWITRTFGGKSLPVDRILSHDSLAKLVGKR